MALCGAARDLYEAGIRVPFIARWKGVVPAGGISHEIIAAQDMMPTLAELAGTPLGMDTDGISLVNALLGKPVITRHRYLYWDYGHNRDVYQQAVRLGDWKGVKRGTNGPVELYYLGADIGETTNLADRYPEIVGEIGWIMKTATTPNPRYEVGKPYQGGPIWKKSEQWKLR